MRPGISLAAFLLVAVSPDCEIHPVPDDPEVVRGELARVLDAQATAWNEGDLEGFMAVYDRGDALLFTSGGKVRRGWQATHDSFEKRYFGDGGAQRGRLEFELVDVRPVGSGAAVVLGEWSLTETREAGHGVFSLVFERQHGHWRIVHDHTSAGGQ